MHSYRLKLIIEVFFLSCCIILLGYFPAHALSLTGKVIDPKSSPAAGAIIDLYSPESTGPTYSAICDASGVFTFAEIVEMNYQIQIKAAGHPDQWFHDPQNTVYRQFQIRMDIATVPDTFRITITDTPIDNPGNNTIAITFTDSTGGTLADSSCFLHVALLRRDDGFLFLDTSLGTAKSVSYTALQPAEYAVYISNYGHYSQYFNPDRNTQYPSYYFTVSGGQTSTHSIRLSDPPAGSDILKGVCYSETPSPLPNVTVSLCTRQDTMRTLYSATTDASGYFRFNNILDIEYYVRLDGAGYPQQWFSPGEIMTTIYPNATTWAMHYASDSMRIMLQSSPLDNPATNYFMVAVRDSASALRNGSVTLINAVDNTPISLGYDTLKNIFIVQNIPAGNYYVKCAFPPYPTQYYSPTVPVINPLYSVYISDNQPVSVPVLLSMNPAASTSSNSTDNAFLFGKTTDENGNSVGDASITVYTTQWNIIRQYTTNADGTLGGIAVPSQDVYIGLSAPNYPMRYLTPQGTTDINPTSLYFSPNDTFTIAAVLYSYSSASTTSNRISGSVIDQSTGQPVGKARIVLLDFDPGQNFNVRQIWSSWTTMTDSAGAFLIEGFPQGTYSCFAEAETLGYVAQFYPSSDLYTSAQRLTYPGTSGSNSISFKLRKGAVLKGTVADKNNSPVSDAVIYCNNQENTRWFEAYSRTDGSWQVTGLPGGIWNVWIRHDQYTVVNDTLNRVYQLIEGVTTSIPAYVMQKGGYISGTFTSALSLDDTTYGYTMREGELSLLPAGTTADMFRWPREMTGIVFEPSAYAGLSGSFSTHVTAPGTFYVCYSPRAGSNNSNYTSTSTVILPGTGYLLFGASAPASVPNPLTIPSGDTLRNLTMQLPKGYYIFGTVKTETGAVLTSNFGIDVFVKRDSTYYRVTHGNPTGDGRFEIPGMIDNEDYWLQVWAEGYPAQWWTGTTTAMSPSQPYHFSASGYSGLSLSVVRNPQGTKPDQMQGLISLGIDDGCDSTGYPLLTWDFADQSLPIDLFTVYRRTGDGTISQVTTIANNPTVSHYSCRDRIAGLNFREYIVTGQGQNLLIKSNPTGYDSRNVTASTQLWLDVYGDREGIELEWGMKNRPDFTQSDSIAVFRRTGSDPARLLFRRPAWENHLNDYSWEKSDSGKTLTYYIELMGKSLTTPQKSFTLSASFFSQLTKTFRVGPYEKYQRISDAISAASDFDRIEISPGTYRENLSTAGKLLSFDGSWDYGSPPVIDGGGAIALTIPFCKTAGDWRRPRINGIAFKNSSVAIKSYSPLETEACLFENVSLAVSMNIDSTAMTNAMAVNPFTPSQNDAWIGRCTFIGRKSGNMIAAATAVGKAEQPGYSGTFNGYERFYITPALSLSSSAAIEHSNIAFYGREGMQSTFPVSVQGNTSTITCSRSNLYKTATSVNSGAVMLDSGITAVDPQFTDSTWWFIASSSPLYSSTYDAYTGYDVRRYDFNNGGTTESRPSAVRDIKIIPVGLSTIYLRWNASPASENVKRYHVYRLPADPSLFYINQQSQWDLKIPEDSIFTVIDSFSTDKTAFLDTTVTTGSTYLYVVAAVNADGRDGDIVLPAPPDITTYFTKTLPAPVTFKSGTWQMIGRCGSGAATFSDDSRAILYGWDDRRVPDKLYANYFKSTTIQSTGGYWFKSTVDTQFSVTASAVASLKTIESTAALQVVTGTTGWNLVSSPFPFAVTPAWITTYSAWEWNADSLGYRKATSLKPFKGYWIHTDRDTMLTIWKKPTIASLAAQSLAKSSASPLLWELSLTLQQGNSFDTDNHIGAVAAALAKKRPLTTLEPPAAFEAARLFIVDDAAQGVSHPSLSDLTREVNDNTRTLDWIIGIGASDKPSTLTVGSIATLPDGWHLFWVRNDSISELSEKHPQVGIAPADYDQYGILVATSDLSSLNRYTNRLSLRVPYAPSKYGPVVVNYTIPYLWSDGTAPDAGGGRKVVITMHDLAGRTVTTLVNDRKVPGSYRTLWNGTNGSGQRVASGVYFIRLVFAGQQKVARLYRIR